ncbi:MAG: tetratricopeptide repeat protein [Parasphingorhabdus sp.]|uniref:tetratricopeptide repeat protein n=1 Tax=Parasphingorhabdus sp. TaxID=2709688 RepID=UPI0030031040
MIISLALALAAPADLSVPMTMTEVRFNECVDLAVDDPVSGVVEANKWRIEGGGFLARHCLGFAYAEQFNWTAATTAFVEAAREAEIAKYPRVANFWAQAGNAALAGDQPEKALEYLNAALVQGSLLGLEKGEVHLDRARAHVALNHYDAAKSEFASVHELAPQDPLAWLLSATLARRMGDLPLAKADIAVAAKLAARDPAIALEAGNIAYDGGDTAEAKANWEKAVEIDAESRPAKAAKKYLAQLVTTAPE